MAETKTYFFEKVFQEFLILYLSMDPSEVPLMNFHFGILYPNNPKTSVLTDSKSLVEFVQKLGKIAVCILTTDFP